MKRDRKEYARAWYLKNRQSEIAKATLRAKQGRAKRRELIDKYKLEHGCSRCGYNRCASAIDLHHREQGKKEYTISKMVKDCMSINKMLTELVKCDLLCANCHREEHSAQWDKVR